MNNNYYNEIKNELLNNELYKRVKDYSKNRNELSTYYNVGKLVIEAQGGEDRAKYGDGLIKEYSLKLSQEVGKKYNITTLKRMRQFYLIIEKGAAMRHQLSWSHYRELLSLNNIDKINYYIEVCDSQIITRDELKNRIKSQEYERLSESAKSKLIANEEPLLPELVKNPILIKNTNKYNEISEKILQQIILEDIESFMKELGSGFCFIGKEYPIKIGSNYNYIDLLLYNIEFNCYVVIELKVTKLKKEHIGQIEVYMNYVDKNLKRFNQEKTIGIIVCRENNEYIIEYCSDKRIIARNYELV